MKIVILGPLVKEAVIIDGISKIQTGGIPYYEGTVLKSLGMNPTVFITCSTKDLNWAKRQFKGIKIVHIPSQKTLKFTLAYSKANPDLLIRTMEFASNRIPYSPLLLREIKNMTAYCLAPCSMTIFL